MTKTSRLLGYSLIELILAMTMLTVIGGVIARVSVDGLESFSAVRSDQGIFSSFVEMFTRINNFVRVAVEFPSTYTAPNGASYTAGPTTLIMKLPGLSSVGAPECQGFDYVVFYMQNAELHELVVAASDSARSSHDNIVVNKLTSLVFTQAKPTGEHRTVTVTATQDYTVQSRTATRSHTQTMAARND